jgi:GntR family transcriptional regulator/MocR family aminotransferase
VLAAGDQVCVEDPGYPAVHRIFEEAGASLLYAPIDQEGLDLRGIPDSSNTRLAYVTPAHQSPLGVIMSATRRLELLDWAQRQNAWIIEDDYDSEFNYQSAPLPALKSIDSMQRVVYCGSFNQALFSNLRLGYLVAPPELHSRILALWHTVGRSVGVSEQLGLAEFMRGPAFLRHLRRARQEYQTLRDIVLATLKAQAPGRYRISGEHAGFHLILWLAPDQDELALIAGAEKLGLVLQPLRQSCRQIQLEPAFVLGFAALTRAQAKHAAGELARLLNG